MHSFLQLAINLDVQYYETDSDDRTFVYKLKSLLLAIKIFAFIQIGNNCPERITCAYVTPKVIKYCFNVRAMRPFKMLYISAKYLRNTILNTIMFSTIFGYYEIK